MILYNGKLVNKEDICISYEDRGYYFGDGVYEVFRIYNGKIFEIKAHLNRLQRSAASIHLNLPYSTDEIQDMIENLLKHEKLDECTLYLQITRGAAPRAHTFPTHTTPTLLAYCNPVVRLVDKMKNGISAVTLNDIRWLRCDIKSLNLLPNTMAKQHAVTHGVEEAILHREGRVTECSASNLMIVRDDVIYTHPANNLILHGVTRKVVLNLAAELGISVQEIAFDIDELYAADEAFITGTTVEITPVIQVDDRPIDVGLPGEITQRLQQAFEELIR